MKHFILFYDVASDYVDRRAKHREAHLTYAWAAHERGELVLGGALAEPPDGAVILFYAESRDVAERFAKADPYVLAGLVRSWKVREWTTVAGATAAMPVKPSLTT
jgi:uncharacterized protein